jgi:hypothetical protein
MHASNQPRITAFLVGSVVAITGCSVAPADEASTDSSDALTGNDTNGTGLVSGTGGVGLRVRSQPNTSSATIGFITEGTTVAINCRIQGQSVNGTTAWDYLPQYRGYASELYIANVSASIPDCGANVNAPRPQAPPISPLPDPMAQPPSQPGGVPALPPGDLQAAIVAEARRWLGTRSSGNCQPFSSALGRPCEAWCTDFLAYVWRQNGVDINGLTAWAGTVFDYGAQHGTSKARDAFDVQPGDAVVWGQSTWAVAHVGMVAEVLPDGSLSVINGNWASAVQEQVMSRGSVVGGYGIGAFVSPAVR